MKKLILSILILSTLSMITVEAKTDTSEVITNIETTMYGYDFSSENEILRLERIEKHLYGEKKKGNIQTRLKNIQDDMGYTVVKKKKNIENKFVEEQLKEDSTVEYPMVDKLEEEVFKTTYKNENIYKRLERLETKIFNQTSNDSLNNRVDKLATVITPKKQIKRQQDDNIANELNNYYRNNGLEPVSNDSVPFQLATLEQNILKNDYMNDNILCSVVVQILLQGIKDNGKLSWKNYE